MEILIDDENAELKFEENFEEKIKEALKITLNHLGYGDHYEISITIVNEKEIKNLNNEYRGVDSVTDVLSFPLFEKYEIPSEGMLGDIVICSKKVIEQADAFGHSKEREFVYLTVHSLLHLLGYDHIEEDDRFEMRTIEKEIMKKLGIFK